MIEGNRIISITCNRNGGALNDTVLGRRLLVARAPLSDSALDMPGVNRRVALRSQFS
jgi:hypothetical protein